MPATAHYLTTSIIRLDMMHNDIILAPATGFIVSYNKKWFICSNWHVFSGRNPSTGQPISSHGGTPNRCMITVLMKDHTNGLFFGKTHYLDIGNPLDGSARWLQHSEYGQKVDIAVIEIDPYIKGMSRDLLETNAHDPDFWVDLGGELFLPGFPLSIASVGFLPIWKRASLATSLELNSFSNSFLVDTASREGMSGSPCLAICNSSYYRLDRSTNKMNLVHRPLSWRLLGVYSGRYGSEDQFAAQLGIIWRFELLIQTLDAGVAGTVALR